MHIVFPILSVYDPDIFGLSCICPCKVKKGCCFSEVGAKITK